MNDCTFFVYRAKVNPWGQEPTRHHGCLLKTEVMVTTAMETEFNISESGGIGSDDYRWRYCNMRNLENCYNVFDCVECDGTKRCIWSERVYLTGPKYCYRPGE